MLDIDLDFFLDGIAHNRSHDRRRLNGSEYEPWPVEDALSYLEERCLLSSPRPGFVVEGHGEIFSCWRGAIEAEQLSAPFHLTHIDAHADLGQGELNHPYLLSDLAYRGPAERRHPREGPDWLTDGNFLAFAIACQWISELVYVHHPAGGADALHFYRQGFDWNADQLQIVAVAEEQLNAITETTLRYDAAQIDYLDPPVPYREVRGPDYRAGTPFDLVCLARSPAYTPPEADPLFDAIREHFIDELPRTA